MGQGYSHAFDNGDPWPNYQYDNHRLLAFATNDTHNQVWSTFPIANGLDSHFEHYYDWNITQSEDLLELPIGAQLPFMAMSVSSTPASQVIVGSNSLISYIINVENKENKVASGTLLHLQGTSDIAYQTVAGATCLNCAANQDWLLQLPILPANSNHTITVTGQLPTHLSNKDTLTTTIVLSQTFALQTAAIAHQIDNSPPNINITLNPGKAISEGTLVVEGTANDPGVGVALVEGRLNGGTWQTATGTTAWSRQFTSPTKMALNTTVQIEVRGTDYFGSANIVTETLIVDSIPPTTTLLIPPAIGNGEGISGVASDPAPTNAQVKEVAIQLDDENGSWQVTTLYNPHPDNSRDWRFTNFGSGDGHSRTWRVRVTDYADNVTLTGWQTAVIDTTPPNLAITYHADRVTAFSNDLTLQGTVSDGLGINQMTIFIYPDAGATSQANIIPVGGDWSYNLSTSIGSYTLFVEAKDNAGNTTLLGPYNVLVGLYPSSPEVIISLVNQTDVHLSWLTESYPSCSYQVYRHTVPFFTPNETTLIAGPLPATADEYLATGDATDNINYYYQVEAENCGGFTTLSKEKAIFHQPMPVGN